MESSDVDLSKNRSKSDKQRPEYDDDPKQDTESKEFAKFLGVYVKIPSIDGEGNILSRVREKRES